MYSFTGASIPAEAKTISVQYFSNKALTVHPTLSYTFTEKLKDYFIEQTSLKLIKSTGDLEFSGEIVSYQIKPIGIKADETASKNRLNIKVKVRFTNHYDSNKNFEEQFNRYRDYESSLNLSDEDIDTGESIEVNLIKEIVNELVEDVFNKAVVNW
ncbi:MAG: LptE family protein [Bacteroidota bacterium]|nr:LptE family protein [Bacteroidota bacterium]